MKVLHNKTLFSFFSYPVGNSEPIWTSSQTGPDGYMVSPIYPSSFINHLYRVSRCDFSTQHKCSWKVSRQPLPTPIVSKILYFLSTLPGGAKKKWTGIWWITIFFRTRNVGPSCKEPNQGTQEVYMPLHMQPTNKICISQNQKFWMNDERRNLTSPTHAVNRQVIDHAIKVWRAQMGFLQ